MYILYRFNLLETDWFPNIGLIRLMAELSLRHLVGIDCLPNPDSIDHISHA